MIETPRGYSVFGSREPGAGSRYRLINLQSPICNLQSTIARGSRRLGAGSRYRSSNLQSLICNLHSALSTPLILP